MILLIKHPQAAQKRQWQQQHRQLRSGWGVHPSCPHYLPCAWHQPRCSHQPITLKWGFGDTATYQQVPGATGADLYGFPTAHKCGRQPASPQTCKVRGRRKSRGCMTPLHLGCAHSCTCADSAATSDKDLWDIVPCWGREPRNWGGPHELRKWGATSQGPGKRLRMVPKQMDPEISSGFYPPQEAACSGKPPLQPGSQELWPQDGLCCQHLTGATPPPGLVGGWEIIPNRCETMSSQRQSCSSSMREPRVPQERSSADPQLSPDSTHGCYGCKARAAASPPFALHLCHCLISIGREQGSGAWGTPVPQ